MNIKLKFRWLATPLNPIPEIQHQSSAIQHKKEQKRARKPAFPSSFQAKIFTFFKTIKDFFL
jgi:hypothetical protein